MSLIEHLQTVRACRTQPDYLLCVVLLLVVMGTMSGYTGYRPLADFVARHQAELLTLLALPRLPFGFWADPHPTARDDNDAPYL